MFELAERLGRTVRELYTGQMGMTAMEQYLWNRYDLAKARLEQQQSKGKRGRK